jgi:hypothetical protein
VVLDDSNVAKIGHPDFDLRLRGSTLEHYNGSDTSEVITARNGVLTSGTQTVGGDKTFSSTATFSSDRGINLGASSNPSVGEAGDFRYNNGTGSFEGYSLDGWTAVGGGTGASGGMVWVKTSSATVEGVTGSGYLAHTNDVTLNLPVGAIGASIGAGDYNSQGNKITISASGDEKINGSSADFVLDEVGSNVVFSYVDATVGWLLTQDYDAGTYVSTSGDQSVSGQKTFTDTVVAGGLYGVRVEGAHDAPQIRLTDTRQSRDTTLFRSSASNTFFVMHKDLDGSSAKYGLKSTDGGATSTYYNGTERLVTSPTGAYVTGANNINFSINSSSTRADLKLNQSGNGGLLLRTDGGVGRIYVYDTATGSNDQMITMTYGGAVTLRHKDSTKLTTSTSGISVTGSLTASSNVTAYSDRRLKVNIKPLESPLEKVCALGGYTYDRVDLDHEAGIGVIAQEVQEVFPEAVLESEDGILSVSYMSLVAPLIESVKALKAEVEDLKHDISNLRR